MVFRTVFFDWIDSSQSLVNSGIELRLESIPVKLQIFEIEDSANSTKK